MAIYPTPEQLQSPRVATSSGSAASSPSHKAFLDIANDPYVQKDIGAHREAGLESQWLLAATGMRQTD